ncbi:MAG: BrxA family protein [Fervidobacterium sp.]
MNKEALKYIAAFQRVGAIYEESIMLLKEYARDENWKVVKERVLRENLLKKSSSKWTENILRTVKRRFFVNHAALPSGRHLSIFVSNDIPKSSKVQALYQYVCHSDPLVDRMIIGLVGPILTRYGASRLTKQMYFDFYDREAKDHPELKSWSFVVSATWQRKFFAFLRHSGIMEKAPSEEIRKPVVRVEPFTFFLYGLIDKGVSGLEVVNSALWKRYFMSEEDVEQALSSAQERGWIEYRRLGSIVELTTRFPSLEDWLNGALG